MKSAKQCMNSNPCEVTVHTQRKKRKKRKTWKVKRSFNLNPNALKKRTLWFSYDGKKKTYPLKYYASICRVILNITIFMTSHSLIRLKNSFPKEKP